MDYVRGGKRLAVSGVLPWTMTASNIARLEIRKARPEDTVVLDASGGGSSLSWPAGPGVKGLRLEAGRRLARRDSPLSVTHGKPPEPAAVVAAKNSLAQRNAFNHCVIMKKFVLHLICLGVLCVAGCGSPYERLTNDAILQFAELRHSGDLPGIAGGGSGQVETGAIPEGKRVTYPVSVVLHVKLEKDQSRLSYTFTKESKTSKWRLVKASRTTPDGRHENLIVK